MPATTECQDRAFHKLLTEHLHEHVGEVSSCEWVLQFVRERFPPEEVFYEDQLTKWALANDFYSID